MQVKILRAVHDMININLNIDDKYIRFLETLNYMNDAMVSSEYFIKMSGGGGCGGWYAGDDQDDWECH